MQRRVRSSPIYCFHWFFTRFATSLAGCGLLAASLGALPPTAQSAPPTSHAGARPAKPATQPAKPATQPQTAALAAQLCLIPPFEDRATNASLEWISEAFAEGLGQDLNGGELEVMSRKQRRAAFNRAGLPMLATLSRATLLQLGENVDARWLVLGAYGYTGKRLSVQADLIDLRQEHLWRMRVRPAPLDQLEWLQARLAWKLRRRMQPGWRSSFAAFWHRQPPVALSAYESYIRGRLASRPEQRRYYFRAATRLQPDYPPAMYQLGRWYLENQDPATALLWLTRLRRDDPHYWRAQFLAGSAALRLGQNLRAALFFRRIAGILPMPEVLNNWALAESRQGSAQAEQIFRRGLQQADPHSHSAAQLETNLAAYECRRGRVAEAARWLRRARDASSPDQRAQRAQWLSEVRKLAEAPHPRLAASMETPSRHFPANRFRQMAAAMVTFEAQKAQRLARTRRLRLYVQQGNGLLRAGALAGALRDFRAALALDGDDAAAHAGLAQIYATRHEWTEARLEARAALALEPSAMPHVVLARAALAQGQLALARRQVAAALAIEPGLAAASALRAQLH